MGQSESSEDGSVAYIQGKIQHHLTIIKKATVLTYGDFLMSVTELNKVTQSFTDSHGKQLLFAVKAGTDDTFLWKATVRIKCLKWLGPSVVAAIWQHGTILPQEGTIHIHTPNDCSSVNTRTNCVESSRLLNLRQYIILCQEITDQVNMGLLDQTQQGATSISMILKGVDELPGLPDDSDECCICMDNKSEVILACEHRFCERCIDAWNVTHNTCPICRAKVESSDDTWVLTEKPDSDEYASEVKGYLMGLADRTGAPQ